MRNQNSAAIEQRAEIIRNGWKNVIVSNETQRRQSSSQVFTEASQ
jgi:hypothetical protein